MADDGRVTYLALDTPGGALTDISNALRTISGLPSKTDRPETGGFGDVADMHGIVGLRDAGPFTAGGFLQQVAGTRLHGRQVRLMADEFAFHGDFNTLKVGRKIRLPLSETFGDDWRERGVIGRKSSTMSLGGQFNSAAGKSYTLFRAWLATATKPLMSASPAGFAIGNLVDLFQPAIGEFAIKSELDGIVGIDGQFMGHDVVDCGVSLHDLTAETGVINSASVDLTTVTTTQGWAAHLHVSAYSGGGSVTIKIQDSADDAAWADLSGGGFTAVTAVTKQRLTSAAGTVRRYVRSMISAFTATSITYVVAFARRDDSFGSAGTYRGFAHLYGKSATSSFEYGAEGNTAGDAKISGECRLESLDVDYAHEKEITFSATFAVDGALTEGTF
jgi:hypothetical protein